MAAKKILMSLQFACTAATTNITDICNGMRPMYNEYVYSPRR